MYHIILHTGANDVCREQSGVLKQDVIELSAASGIAAKSTAILPGISADRREHAYCTTPSMPPPSPTGHAPTALHSGPRQHPEAGSSSGFHVPIPVFNLALLSLFCGQIITNQGFNYEA